MTSALTRHLKDFSAPDDRRREPRAHGHPRDEAHRGDSGPDLEAIRASARDEGYRVATDELEGRYEQALAKARAAHETACRELRQQLEIEVAETIGARFNALVDDLGRQIGDEAARVLSPFVGHEVERRLADRFAEELRSVLRSQDLLSVTVSGPQPLFARISAHPALEGIALCHDETDAVDLTAEIGSRVLATRMAAFADDLSQVLP